MAAERLSIYLPERLRAVLDLQDGHEGLSNRIAAVLDRYSVVVASHCPALTRAEWCCVLDACNGWASWNEAGETLMTSIAVEVEDGIHLNGLAEKWGLTEQQGNGLVAKLQMMRPAELMAVLERIEKFWRRSSETTDGAMAAAGIVPSDAGK